MKSETHQREHKKIGQWLKQKREAAGLSKEHLAGLIGRHKSFIARYEAGQRLDIIQFTTIALALKARPFEVIECCIADGRNP